MRRLLVGGVALALVVAACTGAANETPAPPATLTTTSSTVVATTTSSSTTTTRAPSGPGHGGTAIIADDQFPPTLNPFAPGGDNFIVAIIGQAWLTGVWDIDGYTLERIPEVVTELPTVANGGIVVNPNRTMTVTYQIRDEAVWSDGVPISGDDFQFTLDTALAIEAESSPGRGPYTDAVIIASEVGDKTFSLTFRRPTMKHEALFQWLIPKHAVEDSEFAEDWNTTTWPSGGPFVLDTFEKNKTVTLVRNDKYWKTDPATGLELPYLDRVEFVFIPETEEILDAFTTRNVDVIQPPPNVDWIKRLESQGDKGAVVEVLAGPVWEHINFQFSDDRLELSPISCNDNLAFRRAIAHAIDREAAAEEAYRGYGRVMQSYVEAYTPSLSTGAWSRYDYNPETAQALYQLAVEETGIECAAVYHTTSNGDIRIRWAKMFAEMMEDAGIPFDLDLRDSSVFFGEMLDDGTWDIGEWAWVGSPGLAGLIGIHDVFDPNGLPPKGSNFYRWGTRGSDVRDDSTKRFAEIVKEMNATVDETQIIALVREAEEILADQVVIIPLSSRLVAGAVWADEIGGFKMNPSQASHTWNIEFWYRTDR